MIIAIDGPAGSGKTTIARLLAKKLGVLYLDTGATYRALTLKALQENIDLAKEESMAILADNLRITLDGDRVFLDGEEVTDKIRSPQIDKNISLPVSFKRVREKMVFLQRKLVENKDAVVEGRDITTVVFPNADYKFYLDADIEERTRRRKQYLQEKGHLLSYSEVKAQILKRDEADFNREFGALKKAEDAIYIDTTSLDIEEVLDVLLSYIKRSNG